MPDSTAEAFMARALALAEASIGEASPNPQVGCVLVHENKINGRENKIIGEGAHRYADRDHAEIVALKAAAAAGHDPRGATAYVTLEPCSHHGRTGPCADALIAAGIARCVVATADPNPAVSGSGLARLRAAGVQVVTGPGEQAARALNDAFAFSIQHHRPFVTLKAALSADGFLAPAPTARRPGEPFWLTGPESRAQVQRLRHASDAILTGIGTVLADDPALTDRTGLPRRRPLLRVILDSSLRLPLDSRLVSRMASTPVSTAADGGRRAQEPDLWVFTSAAAPAEKQAPLTNLGVRVVAAPVHPRTARLDLGFILARLHQEQILSVLVEAGSAVNGAFLDQDDVDRLVLFYSPARLGPDAVPFTSSRTSPFALEQALSHLTRHPFGPDQCVSGLLHDPWATLPDLS